eukprot:m.353369 g.353369  ORF g.353369 m.353369 type:complete len:271 (-) comp16750_c0_seq1:261-1073(-)
MKVNVKTVKEGAVTVDVPSPGKVLDVANALCAEKGDAYAPESLRVIFSGKVLKLDDELEKLNFTDKDFLVVVPGKKSAAKATTPAASAAAPAETSAAAPKAEEAKKEEEAKPESAATTSEATPSATEAPATETPASTSDSAPALQGLAADSPLQFLQQNPQFQQLKRIIHGRPALLPGLLKQLAQQNPDLVKAINDNQEDFYQLINSPLDAPGMGMPPQQPSVQLSPEEAAAIDRLCALGFDRTMAAQAYFACEKNENLAANYLLEHGGF